MLYQKIFTAEKPYHIACGSLPRFPEHRHADFEFNFCIEGEFDITVDKQLFHVSEGSTTVIPPMCAHEIPDHKNERKIVTLIVGVTLLKEAFAEFSQAISTPRIMDLTTEGRGKIRELFLECAEALGQQGTSSELLITGNIHKILAYLLDQLSASENAEAQGSDYRTVKNIEKALDLIYYSYKAPITVEQASALTGYSKSNFCKIFKKVVGESFHQALNRRRVDNAAGLLAVTDMSVSDISAEVGFSETKSFCRVFKSFFGVTPGQYRKSNSTTPLL